MKVVLLACLLALPSLAFAAPLPREESVQLLFTVSNDRDSRLGRIHISYDANGNATGLFILESKDGRESAGKALRLREIESEEGALILEERGFKALFLQGKLDRSSQEGRFQLRYLANGLSRNYDSCEIRLRRSGSNWFVENSYTGKIVDQARIITWGLGIRTLEGICPRNRDSARSSD